MARHISVTVGSVPPPAEPGGQVPGWLKTAANTGLAAVGVTDGDLTAWSGGNTITGTITRRSFNLTATLNIGANAVLDECKITSSADPAIAFTGVNSQVKNCDLIMPQTGGQRVGFVCKWDTGGDDFLISNVRMTGATVHMWLDKSGIVEDFYGYAQTPEVGQDVHRDGFTRRGGSEPVIIRRSRFVCDENATTGAFFLQDTFGGDPVGGVTVTECALEGTGYNMTIEDTTAGGLVVTNNRFRSYAANGGAGFGAVTMDGASTVATWSNNYHWADVPPNYQGASIGSP